MGVIELVNAMHMLHANYNGAFDAMGNKSYAITGFDGTSMGGQIIRQMVRGIYPNRSFNFGGPEKKLKALVETRAALNKGDLLLPDAWQRVREEVSSYRLKDDKLKQDCVMALTGATAIAIGGFNEDISRKFDPSARITQVYA